MLFLNGRRISALVDTPAFWKEMASASRAGDGRLSLAAELVSQLPTAHGNASERVRP